MPLAITMSAQPDHDLAALMQRFEGPLRQYAARILGDQERARDVVQETFLELERSDRRETDSHPVKWLFTVCRNRALNVCRKERRLLFLEDNVVEDRAAADPSPSAQLEKREASEFLQRIIATLPLRQQEILQLKFQGGLSYAEIAEVTRLSVSNVGVIIHNALRRLRQLHEKTARDFLDFEPRKNS